MIFDPVRYLALFMILGNMINNRSNGTFRSEWADWLIEDFKKLCKAVQPKVLKYPRSLSTTALARFG